MKFSQSSRGLPWALVVAIALASLPIGAGVKAEPPINSEADENMSTVATYTESLVQAVKHRSWPPEKVFIAEATSNGENRVTFLFHSAHSLLRVEMAHSQGGLRGWPAAY